MRVHNENETKKILATQFQSFSKLGTILRIVRNLDPKPRTCPYPHTHTHPHAAEPRGNTTCHTAVGSKGGQGAEGGSGKASGRQKCRQC